MNIESIEIISGEPDFEYTPVRQLEVKCEASNAFMPAPTIDEANGRLRALAAKVNANAIIKVNYNTGVSMTSWKSLKATGLAVTKISDEVRCEVCAETIKRAATKCRFCGAERSEEARAPSPAEDAPVAKRLASHVQEPLRDNNNPALIIGLVVGAFILLSMILAAAG